MLAMVDKSPLGISQPALSLTTIASMLAPTGNERAQPYSAGNDNFCPAINSVRRLKLIHGEPAAWPLI